MTNFIRPLVSALNAYKVEPHKADIILDANESSYPLPTKLREKVMVMMAGTELNCYPDPDALMLRRAIAKKEVANEDEILLGNGSDEVIQALITAVCNPGDKILVPTPTFSMYKHIATYLGVETVEDELLDDFSIDPDSILGKIDKYQPKIIFIASPNNPTGAKFNRDTKAAIMNTAPGLVVVDEAYIDYSHESVGTLYEDRSNVITLKTLSKVGMAGIRLGYMMAQKDIIQGVNKVRLPYNINSVTQAVASVVMANFDDLKPVIEKTKEERERIMMTLFKTKGITPYPSDANFILFKVKENPEQLFKGLLAGGVRVRWFEGTKRLHNFMRVTIGTPPENDRFISALNSAT